MTEKITFHFPFLIFHLLILFTLNLCYNSTMSLKKLNNKNLYYIGGIVRDEILGKKCFDVDVTYVGDAIEFCKDLNCDDCEILQINENFGTVRMRFGEEVIDFASTRDESYPQKGHLPVVQDIGCELKRDVLRRDFTVNAIAKSVMTDEVVDYTGGLKDIEAKLLRVLHDSSFIDDPTRIVRALKFAVRFGFELEENTLKFQQEYLENVNYDMSFKRLKKELIETFNLNIQSAYEKFFEYKIYRLLSKNEPNKFDYNIEELVKKYPVENTWLVYMGGLDLDNLPLTKQEKKIVDDYKNLIGLKIENDKFSIYTAFKDKEKESILLYTIATNSDLGLKYFEIKDVKLAISGKDIIGFGIEPSPEFEKCFDYVLKQKLNNSNLSYDDEIALAKEFFRV